MEEGTWISAVRPSRRPPRGLLRAAAAPKSATDGIADFEPTPLFSLFLPKFGAVADPQKPAEILGFGPLGAAKNSARNSAITATRTAG